MKHPLGGNIEKGKTNMNDELDQAKDTLIDRLEELILELLTDTADQAYLRGVGAHLRDDPNRDYSPLEEALDAIQELHHRELIQGAIHAARKREEVMLQKKLLS